MFVFINCTRDTNLCLLCDIWPTTSFVDFDYLLTHRLESLDTWVAKEHRRVPDWWSSTSFSSNQQRIGRNAVADNLYTKLAVLVPFARISWMCE